MKKLYPESAVEIDGLLARHYGFLLNLVTFGKYKKFIIKAVKEMKINPDDKIIDFGAGPGYNAQFMLEYLGSKGKILGLDIGEEAISKFREKFEGIGNVSIEKKRIDDTLPYQQSFDKALISFVIHGLPHPSREKLLDNARDVLNKEGTLFILDYGSFELSSLPFYIRIPFKLFECKFAFDYLERDWRGILLDHGFEVVENRSYFKNFTRLLVAKKYTNGCSRNPE